MRLKCQKATNEETKEMLKGIGEYTVSVQSPAEIFEHLRILLFSFEMCYVVSVTSHLTSITLLRLFLLMSNKMREILECSIQSVGMLCQTFKSY